MYELREIKSLLSSRMSESYITSVKLGLPRRVPGVYETFELRYEISVCEARITKHTVCTLNTFLDFTETLSFPSRKDTST